MFEKTKRVVIDRWPSFNDVAGGARFINGVSEPVAPHEALRIACALSGRVVEADAYAPDAWEGIEPVREDEAIAAREDTPPDAPASPGTSPEEGPQDKGASEAPQTSGSATSGGTGRARSRGASRDRR
jgi:hypothetical protein